jgi:hypothetical protein
VVNPSEPGDFQFFKPFKASPISLSVMSFSHINLSSSTIFGRDSSLSKVPDFFLSAGVLSGLSEYNVL